MSPHAEVLRRLRDLADRLDALSLRERGLIFAAGATLVYIAWQTLLMSPLSVREHAAEERLDRARRQLSDLASLDPVSPSNPTVAAAQRNRALKGRLAALDADLRVAAAGYVAPERMIEVLRQILADQHGLTLVSLDNLPVQSLSSAAAAANGAETGEAGPYLHPVELVVEGDFASLVEYLRTLEAMPWRMHWQEVHLESAAYPSNRVRIVVGSVSLSRDWISL